ncbi:hypothetical protein SELMODRAFT_125297 [Selaginella moellendorffii]|uniref:ABC1 atypical kinase-like domain-containing protein n=1 Tax=Selaginella moellendorffii TaxID=88036 RepID=D8SUJ3_SELML|nr:hypothetical protein SELMODRAFT_125297 [Selaginella moellendorffii]
MRWARKAIEPLVLLRSRKGASFSSSDAGARSKWIKVGSASLGGIGTLALAWALTGDGDRQRRLKLLWTVPLRLARDVATASAIVAVDYKYSLWGLEEGSLEKTLAKHEVHLRCANRLQALCFKNGGIYIKLGQHLGQLEYLIPPEYVKVMQDSLLDKCPVSSYERVCDVFKSELGRLPHEVFVEFDPEPFASASLAQVHVAKTHDGKKVAVKVQHMHLTDSAAADTATVGFVVNLVYWLFPSFDYRWLLDEVKESLPKELDFNNEIENARMCMDNFKKLSPRIVPFISVPEVHLELSTSKLLTMEFIDGIKVTSVEGIKNLDLRPNDVAKLISEAFAHMIFRHGFVHCDPHAANLLVRVAPSGGGILGQRKRPQLVLLDHGMYKTLEPSIRAHYAGLWKALVFADAQKIKEHSLGLGAGDLYVLFAGVLTMRPWSRVVESSIDHLNVPPSEEGREEIQMYASQYVMELSELLRRLPRVVLMLLKTNDCLRTVDRALFSIEIQGAPVNTYVIVGRESSRALARLQLREGGSNFWSYVSVLVQRLEVELRLLSLQVIAWVALAWQKMNASRPLVIQQG